MKNKTTRIGAFARKFEHQNDKLYIDMIAKKSFSLLIILSLLSSVLK